MEHFCPWKRVSVCLYRISYDGGRVGNNIKENFHPILCSNFVHDFYRTSQVNLFFSHMRCNNDVMNGRHWDESSLHNMCENRELIDLTPTVKLV